MSQKKARAWVRLVGASTRPAPGVLGVVGELNAAIAVARTMPEANGIALRFAARLVVEVARSAVAHARAVVA